MRRFITSGGGKCGIMPAGRGVTVVEPLLLTTTWKPPTFTIGMPSGGMPNPFTMPLSGCPPKELGGGGGKGMLFMLMKDSKLGKGIDCGCCCGAVG
jgi:hypothetical protein